MVLTLSLTHHLWSASYRHCYRFVIVNLSGLEYRIKPECRK